MRNHEILFIDARDRSVEWTPRQESEKRGANMGQNVCNPDENTTASMVYVTCGSLAQARQIGRSVVEERLAACANIIDGVHSVFRWEGVVQEGEEVVLILKTRASGVSALSARVKELHSFDVPCVVEIPLGKGNPDYFAWIAGECTRD